MPTRIVTISELKVRLGALMAELERQGIPLYVTQHGKPKAVLTRYDEYEALTKKVEDLEKLYNETKDKKDRLEHEIELCRLRLIRAEKLTTGLASEHERWKENVGILDSRIKQLIGDVFVAAACVSYYGPFTGIFRQKLY